MAINTKSDNIFNLFGEDLSKLEIKENLQKDNCTIRHKDNSSMFYHSFIIDSNSKTKTICTVTFYKSSQTNKYLPRLAFRKVDQEFNEKTVAENKAINISFTESTSALSFWKLIGFLWSFKDLVDTDEFARSYKVLSKKDSYFIEFSNKSEKEKVDELKELILKSDIKETDIKSIVFENRKKTIRSFLYLLKNPVYKGRKSIDIYKEKYDIKGGEESVWHHFLKSNDWILGLNVDIKFIQEFYDEQQIGNPDSKGKGSPKTDLLGISDYTTLVELKHASTDIFKKEKSSKSRSNTWDFSADFIEGISQCLGQKHSLEKNYESKSITNGDGKVLDKNKTFTIDPRSVFIIGCREREFPHDLSEANIVKSKTFEQFRRNTRNVDIITFDELFERAYHIIFSETAPSDWFSNKDFDISH